jgi:hypothetical protein
MPTATPEDALVGRWGKVQGVPRVLVDLHPNGLGSLFASACIWSASEHELRLVTPDKPNETHFIPYSFEAEKLKVVLDRNQLTFERLEAPAEYRRPKAREQPQLLSHGFVKVGSDVYSAVDYDGGLMAVGSSCWVHIRGASAQEFQALAPGVGKDANAVYCFRTDGGRADPSRLVAADPKTFRILPLNYFRPYFADAKNVFTQRAQLVKREQGSPKRLGSFDGETFSLGPGGLLKDHTGLYAPVPLPKSPDVKELLDQLLRLQLSIYERVSSDVDSITEQNCDKLPAPSPLTWDDLPTTAR